MTNPFRGELEVKLNGTTHKTRMTVDACMKVEAATVQSLVKLTGALAMGELTISEIVGVLHPAIRGGGNYVTENQVADWVYQAGIAPSMVAAGEILANVLGGAGGLDGESAEKNVEEAAPDS